MDGEPFPPVGFVPASSRVAGIEVYQPGAEIGQRPEVVDFKCPQCGATTAYCVEAGGLLCQHCGHHTVPQGNQLGRTAEQFEFEVETLDRSQNGWGSQRKEISCRRCGAEVSVPLDTLAYTCPFCGSNKVMFREPLEDILRPRYLVPFKVDLSTCKGILSRWLGSSWMIPASLRDLASQENGQKKLGAFHPLYIPYWTFSATSFANWKASVAHERTEYVFVKGERRAEKRIEWRNEAGKVQKRFDNLLVPGTTRLNMSTLSRVDSFDLSDLTLYEPAFLAGMDAQAYDFPLEKAWEAGRRILRERTRQACLDRASSTTVRNFTMKLDFSDEEWRYILVPVYTSVYQYQGKTYQVLINGQTGRIAGPRPVDWTKFWLVIAAILAPGLLLGLLGLALSGSETGAISGALGLFFLVVGLVIAFFQLKAAMEMENV
jgi:DNA-directed RNA polymerase subunit RPC12/RpoP